MSTTPRFPNVYCSQCGRDFGPGNHGFSHCSSHRGLVKAFPEPQPCHACEAKYAGAVCPICKTERAAFTALKAMTARLPLTECSYYHGQPCNCGGRGVCLPAA